MYGGNYGTLQSVFVFLRVTLKNGSQSDCVGDNLTEVDSVCKNFLCSSPPSADAPPGLGRHELPTEMCDRTTFRMTSQKLKPDFVRLIAEQFVSNSSNTMMSVHS